MNSVTLINFMNLINLPNFMNLMYSLLSEFHSNVKSSISEYISKFIFRRKAWANEHKSHKLLWNGAESTLHCLAKTWIYLTPYVCTERIFHQNRDFTVFKHFSKTHSASKNWPIWTPKEALRCELPTSFGVFSKIFLLYTNGWLSKIRSVHTYGTKLDSCFCEAVYLFGKLFSSVNHLKYKI